MSTPQRIGTATPTNSGTVQVDVAPPSGDPVAAANLGLQALTYAATISVDPTQASVFTCTLTGAATINATSGGVAGQRITFILTSDGTGRTATFGTNFLTAATLAGTASKTCALHFISNGTAFVEVGRAGAAGGTAGM